MKGVTWYVLAVLNAVVALGAAYLCIERGLYDVFWLPSYFAAMTVACFLVASR